MVRKNMWRQYTPEQAEELEALCARYRAFLNEAKTERECVKAAVRMAREAGYRDLEECVEEQIRLKAGDKVYLNLMGKSLILFHLGQEPLEKGINIIGSHADSPRLDIKQNPLYEDSGMAYLETHYYGGMKKYQWVTIPLAIHGTVVKKDGTAIDVVIGEKEDDPVLVISDLLSHLSAEQKAKPAKDVIPGEGLDVLVGTKPDGDGPEEESGLVIQSVLRFLEEAYGMEEEDFLSAELEMVPAAKARDCGLDRSMILAYGQDDRICVFTSLAAMLEVEAPRRTSCCILVDKEEVGSGGATGMRSRFFEDAVAELLTLTGDGSAERFRRCMHRSSAISADVCAGYDPLYASAFEKKNTAQFGKGLALNKYTGSAGKRGCNDANAEFVARLRGMFDRRGIGFQTGEMGKVDQGGGGTISFLLGQFVMNVIDGGVPLLSMHAPCEVSSKADIYETYRGYCEFYREME